MSAGLSRIESMLADRIGLNPQTVGSNLVSRAVKLRMIELKIQNLDEYALLLDGSEAELQALIEEVVVPESWFFRDEAPFRFFQEKVRAEWLANRSRAPLRALSIPCAGGEEPYSIVMALAEIGLAPERHTVDAVDISARRLDGARRGVFFQNAFRGGDLAYRDRYFTPLPQGFAVRPTIQNRVRFLQASVLDPGLLVNEPPYDVIFCRNLLIYLSEFARAAVMTTLDRLLAADGVLIIGHADRLTGGGAEPRFRPAGESSTFAYRRITSPSSCPSPPYLAPIPVPPWTDPIHPPSRMPPPSWPGRSGREMDDPPPEPRPHHETSPMPARERDDIESLVIQATELVNQGRNDDAIALCNQYLLGPRRSAAAYHLLGIIYQSVGNRAGAEDCFHKAVYLDPDHDEALLALALNADRKGHAAMAAGYRRRAERARLKKGVS